MSNDSDKFSQGNKKRLLLFLFSCLLFFGTFDLSCKKKPLTEEYFPHKAGDRWKYRIYDETDYFIREFSGTAQSGDPVFLNWVKTTFDEEGNQISQDTNYLLATDTIVSFFEDLNADGYVFLKLPMEVDTTWTFYIDEEPITARVVSKEEYSVQAGTFPDVYAIKYDDPENEETRWIYYAPNVGIIRDALYDSDGELESADELIEYPVED